MGTIIDPKYWGRGYSAEAHLLVMDCAFNELKLHRIFFVTASDNHAMKKFLAETLKAYHEGTMRGDVWYIFVMSFVDNYPVCSSCYFDRYVCQKLHKWSSGLRLHRHVLRVVSRVAVKERIAPRKAPNLLAVDLH
jgi:hypothetical protein